MTRLNLNETCLLAASGELDSAARGRLEAYLADHPAARANLERLTSDMERLRSLPRHELTDEQKRDYAAAIKQGIQEKLQQAQHEEILARRRRLIYRALATISAAAAGVVIVAGVLMINESAAQKRRTASAEQIYNEIAGLTGSQQQQGSPYEEALGNVASSIHELQTQNPGGAQDSDMGNLLDALASVPADTTLSRPWDPGRF